MPRSTFVRRVRFGGFRPLPAIIKNGGKWIMKVLVTGVKGQLGHDVMNELAFAGLRESVWTWRKWISRTAQRAKL